MIKKIFQFENGVRVLNCTKHALNFQNGIQVIVVPPSGLVIDANISEQVNQNLTALYSGGDDIFGNEIHGLEIITPTYYGSPEVIEKIDNLRKQFTEAGLSPVLFVGSQIAAQAYPGIIAALVPVAGFERVEWANKRMRIDKFTMF